jgi:hypothetical protein
MKKTKSLLSREGQDSPETPLNPESLISRVADWRSLSSCPWAEV